MFPARATHNPYPVEEKCDRSERTGTLSLEPPRNSAATRSRIARRMPTGTPRSCANWAAVTIESPEAGAVETSDGPVLIGLESARVCSCREPESCMNGLAKSCRVFQSVMGRAVCLADGRQEQAKEPAVRIKDWEVTIQQMIVESNHESKESGKQKGLRDWRVKLAQEPHLLQPFQIDQIVREVRKRLTSVGEL